MTTMSKEEILQAILDKKQLQEWDGISTRIISSASDACSYMFQAGRSWQRLDKDCEETYRLAAQETFDRMCADLELLKNKEK